MLIFDPPNKKLHNPTDADRYYMVIYLIIKNSVLGFETMIWGIVHGGLYRWRENSLPIFLFQKLKEILT